MVDALLMHNYNKVALKYALAVIDLAESKKGKALASLKADVADLRATIDASKELQRFLSAPMISDDDKAAVLDDISQKSKFSEISARFFLVLARSGRASIISEALNAVDDEIARRNGDVVAKVQSVAKLTQKQSKEIATNLKKTIAKDANITIDNVVNPDILGGLIITLGSTLIDDSLRSKLSRLKTNISSKKAA